MENVTLFIWSNGWKATWRVQKLKVRKLSFRYRKFGVRRSCENVAKNCNWLTLEVVEFLLLNFFTEVFTGNVTDCYDSKRSETVEELTISEQGERSPSKSTTTESQVTVRSSPLVPEAVPVCRQCHKNCLSNVLANKAASQKTYKTDCFSSQETNDSNDWQGIVLLGN